MLQPGPFVVLLLLGAFSLGEGSANGEEVDNSLVPVSGEEVDVLHGMVRTGQVHRCDRTNSSVHSFHLKDIFKTREIRLEEYRGKVLVIVNVASF